MVDYVLPYDLLSTSLPDAKGEVQILAYESQTLSNADKNKVHLDQYLFSIVIAGEKGVYYPTKKAYIHSTHFLLLSPAHCLMTEKIASDGWFKSVLVFFDKVSLKAFFLKYPRALEVQTNGNLGDPFQIFEKDPFVHHFTQSLDLMLSEGYLSQELKQLKWEELMLYLCKRSPEQMQLLRASGTERSEEFELRKTVENHFQHPISVEELAFLCHMSLSTFKRKFTKYYGCPPNRWMLQKRMERAAHLLEYEKEKASEVYYKVGYENLSSFIQSFKQAYGVTPKEYQNQKMAVLL